MSRLDQAFVSAFARNGKRRSRPPTDHGAKNGVAGNGSAVKKPGKAAVALSAAPAAEISEPKPFESRRQVDCFSWPEATRRMGSLVAAGFQSLAERIHRQYEQETGRLLLMTSCYRGEGRTSIALCLARALARQGEAPVALVDGDFANPQLAEQLGIETDFGFEEVLSGRGNLGSALVESRWDHVTLLPVRRPVERPDDLATPSRLNQVLASLRPDYGVVLVDGAPLFSSPNPLATQADVDAAILVSNPAVTAQGSLEQAVRQLEEADVSLVGVVENFV